MIAGILLRHYKTYEGLYYVPIFDKIENKFSVYVGQNGVGKSSILEALNTFFNKTTWNKNKNGRKDDAYIAPVFLIEKQKADELIDEQTKAYYSFISDYFWNCIEKPELISSAEIKKFFKLRDDLANSTNKNDYYFFILGIHYEGRRLFFSSFDNDLKNKIAERFEEVDENKIFNSIRAIYSYIYIPVEASVNEILKLESTEMQELMSKDILEEISSVIQKKYFDKPDEYYSRGKISIVDYLNNSLDTFIEEVNTTIQSIHPDYSFRVEAGLKKNLTPLDLRNKILEAYFSIRSLKKGNKEIEELSSGEQRVAIIDIATAFITQKGRKIKYVILAIDEPEASMHISNCYNQFKRLEAICEQPDSQVLITSHWYGSLPTILKGNLHHIENKPSPTISTFDFLNYYEDRRSFPNDILLKSFFELVSSIMSTLKAENETINWLICEGSDDKKYLEYYLKTIKNLKVLPVGGAGNVIKLYKYLYIPFSEKTERPLIKGKVLCLIDSDQVQKTVEFPCQVDNVLKIVRHQIEPNNTIELKSLENVGHYQKTTIEDCLNPSMFYTALNNSINKFQDASIIDKFQEFEQDTTQLTSRVEGDNSLLKPKTLAAANNHKKDIYELFKKNNFKHLLAQEYIEIASKNNNADVPELFNKINSFFKNTKQTDKTAVVEKEINSN